MLLTPTLWRFLVLLAATLGLRGAAAVQGERRGVNASGEHHDSTDEGRMCVSTTMEAPNWLEWLGSKFPCQWRQPWKKGKRLGGGSTSRIWDVFDEHGEAYALKVARSGHEKDVEHEVKVMTTGGMVDIMEAHDRCGRFFVKLKEDEPCVDGEHMTNAFVMPKMMGTLLDIQTENRSSLATVPCKSHVRASMVSMLQCLGENSLVHGDIKLDNIFYGDEDEDGCPTNLRLADFGHTWPSSSVARKYLRSYYDRSGHLPSGLFKGGGNFPMSTRRSRGTFELTCDIDVCSTAFLFDLLFEERFPFGDSALDCGSMGNDRDREIKVPALTSSTRPS